VLQKICAAAWRDVLGKPYLDFLELSRQPRPKTRIGDGHPVTLLRIARLLSEVRQSGKAGFKKHAGAKLVAEASLEETEEVCTERQALQSFEFLALVDEVKEVIADNEYGDILVLCDEANFLSPEINEVLLRRCFEVFAANSVRFAISAHPQARFLELPVSFEQLHLGPFKDEEPVAALVEAAARYYREQAALTISVTQLAVTRVFEVARGHPYIIQAILARIFDAAVSERAAVDEALVNRCALDVLDELEGGFFGGSGEGGFWDQLMDGARSN
jgi:hypothetical protein